MDQVRRMQRKAARAFSLSFGWEGRTGTLGKVSGVGLFVGVHIVTAHTHTYMLSLYMRCNRTHNGNFSLH